MNNQEIAAILEGVAKLLELQEANPFRVRSYRRTADEIRQLDESVAALYSRGGESELRRIEGVGDKLARSLRELVETGCLRLFDQLESNVAPEILFMRVPGIGQELADRIHDELGITTLEELERTAHDGTLARVEGIGHKRLTGIQHALAGMLSRSNRREDQTSTHSTLKADRPDIGTLLELDREYRERATNGELPTIAPRRFNPTGDKWLSIMKATSDGWNLTLLYSNTKRAHDLHKTDDWVVVYYEMNRDHDQCTIVTATKGELAGKRVVRGRERECRKYYGS